jgi:type IV pilus assembly protein PilM
MAKEATTIYIDDSAIWVLTTKGRQAQKWVNMPLEPGLVKDGVILEEDAVANRVNELWRSQKIGTGRVIAGISGINCLYRLLTLPELSRDLLPEAVMR